MKKTQYSVYNKHAPPTPPTQKDLILEKLGIWGSQGFQTSEHCKFKASPSQVSLSYKGRSHPTELKLREKAEFGGASFKSQYMGD